MKEEAIWGLDFRVVENVGEGKEAFVYALFSLKSESIPLLKRTQELTRQSAIGFKANVETLLAAEKGLLKEDGKWRYESTMADNLDDGGELSASIGFGLKNKLYLDTRKADEIMRTALIGFVGNIKRLLGEEVRQSSIKFTEVWEF